MKTSFLVLCASAATAFGSGIVRNGDFSAGLSGWEAYGDRGAFSVTRAPGRAEDALLFRCNPDKAGQAVHLDQTVSLETGTVYVVTLRVYNDGKNLRPGLRVAGMDWQTIGTCEATAATAWQDLRAFFSSRDATQARVQLFGAGRDNASTEKAGRAWFSSIAIRKATQEDLRRLHTATVRVAPGEKVIAVSPLFFGVNALFWIENDASRADGKLERLLREMRCSLLRFPGGEVADNYHWQANLLDNKKDFPYADGAPTLDLSEFWTWRTAIGAEAIFVVNLESGYLHGNPEEGVAEAVAWVRDCCAKGRRVKYWEIGNETYLSGTRYPLTAKEYAAALVKYGRAMKAADPSVLIGAIGPESPRAAALIDAVKADPAELRPSLAKGERKKAAASLKELPRRENPTPWWPTVCGAAKGAFDFAVIHRYDQSRLTFDREFSQPLRLKEQTQEIRAYFVEALGREIPVALTEWNVSKNAKLDRLEHALTIAEQIGNYLEGGMTMANFWPMRYDSKTSEAGFRMMIDYATNEPRAAYFVMREFSLHGRGAVVKSACAQTLVYAVATREGKAVTLFLVNRSFWPGGMEAAIEMPGAASVDGRALFGDEQAFAGARLTELAVSAKEGGRFECRLPPGSFSVLRFTLD